MSGYVLGLLTVPVVLAVIIGLWAALTLLGKVLVNVTTLVYPDMPGLRRDSMGALIATATRAVMIRFGGATTIVIVRGRRVDNALYREALNALREHGPYRPKPIQFNPKWAEQKRAREAAGNDEATS